MDGSLTVSAATWNARNRIDYELHPIELELDKESEYR